MGANRNRYEIPNIGGISIALCRLNLFSIWQSYSLLHKLTITQN